MSSHEEEPPRQPMLMLAVRFVLEFVAFFTSGLAGWRIGGNGTLGALLAIVFLLISTGLWGTLTVPDDPDRNPRQIIVVPGWVRVVVEFAVFGFAAWSLWVFVSRAAAVSFLTVLAVITVVGWGRIWWLLRHR